MMAVASVIRGHPQIVTGCRHLLFEDQEVLRPAADDGDDVVKRQRAYLPEEKASMDRFLQDGK